MLSSDIRYGVVTPVLRIFDEEAARAFYIDFLEFRLDWEHRFEESLPWYAQISRGACTLHLSGHHGDGSPGVHLRIETERVEALQRELLAKAYRYARPGLETKPWGTRELQLVDPFSNRLTFFEHATPFSQG